MDNSTTPQTNLETQTSNKEYLVAGLLAWFIGFLGVDRFYLGYTGLGILKLVTLGGCGIWSIIDFILIATGNLKTKNGQNLQGFNQKNIKTLIITVVLATIAGFIASIAYNTWDILANGAL